MTHTKEHVVVQLKMPLNSEKPKGFKVWHCALALLVVGFLVGLAF